MTTISPATLSNSELLEATVRAAGDEQHATAHLLTLLAELDARRLYLGEGCSSLFSYCTRVLNLSEHAAYHRIEAARAARRFPILLDLVAAPDGDVTEIVTRALTVLVDHLERTTIPKTSRPRTRSTPPGTRNRHIPAHVKREVWARDGGRCAFIGSHGRCTETGGLEFHHLMPFARGGATDVANISLRCRAHNGFESEKVFGPFLPPHSPHATRSGPS